MKGQKRPVFREIKLDLIDRPSEVARMEISEEGIQELAESIKNQGLLQPIIVAPRDDRFEIAAGDRRYLAVKSLGWDTITCSVKEMDAAGVAYSRAAENLQREDLSPIEEAMIYYGLQTKLKLSLEDISRMTGKSAGVIQRYLYFLDMPDAFQKALHYRQINRSVAEELMGCQDPERRAYFLTMAVEHGITKLVARMWVDEWKKGQRKGPSPGEGGRPGMVDLGGEKYYKACDVCQDPVEFHDLKQLGICAECLGKIVSAIEGSK